MKIFEIEGKRKLTGEVEVSGSKNAALPILAATLLVKGDNIIRNLPDISDVQLFLKIFEDLGAEITKKENTVRINTDKIKAPKDFLIDHHGINKMRATILLIGPLLARFGEIKIPFPGGCVLGKRSADTHLSGFEQLGAEIINSKDYLHLRLKKGFPQAQKVVLPEMSVTATENLLILAASLDQETEIRLTAAEPHVQNLCEALVSAGAKITGKGSNFLKIQGAELKNINIDITPDMLEAGTLILASALTHGDVVVKGAIQSQLDSFYQKLIEAGVNMDIHEDFVHVKPPEQEYTAVSLKTAVFPGFPTDLMAPFAVLMTQAQGVSRIFETLFEGRFAFLFELEKMGAHVELLNPHQSLIIGKTPLQGALIASQDIRAGAAMVLAGLCATGTTQVSNISYIFRGYQNIDQKINSLGGKIILK